MSPCAHCGSALPVCSPNRIFQKEMFRIRTFCPANDRGWGMGRNWSFSSFMGKTPFKKEKCRDSSITVFSSGETKESLYGRGRATKHRADGLRMLVSSPGSGLGAAGSHPSSQALNTDHRTRACSIDYRVSASSFPFQISSDLLHVLSVPQVIHTIPVL